MTHSKDVKAFANQWSFHESRKMFLFQVENRLSRVHCEWKRHSDKLEQSKHYHELIDDSIL